MHIPVYEFMNLARSNRFVGHYGEDVACSSVDTDLFESISNSRRINWIACGHDHLNDFYGTYKSIRLSYGRKTGYGDFGPDLPLIQGARVFKITENPYSIETYIREADGNIDYQTSRTRSTKQKWKRQYKCAGTWESVHTVSDWFWNWFGS